MAIRYTRETDSKKHTREAFEAANDLLKQMPAEGQLGIVRQSMEDYLKLSYGGAPEVYYVTRVALKDVSDRLNIKIDEKDVDRFVHQLISMNYGAFMGFRPALAVRNLTQTLVTTLPMLGPKYVAQGIKFAFSGGREEARRVGAIPVQSLAVPFEDAVYKSTILNATKLAVGEGAAKPLRLAVRTLDVGSRLSKFSLEGGITVGKKKKFTFPIGWYVRADHMNRAIAYGGQRNRVLDAFSKHLAPGKTKSIDAFNEAAGLSQLGPAITDEFHKILTSGGLREAAEWAGVQMANETQWIYQL